MDKAQVDALIRAMLQTGERVSDLLFITGKAALVEVDGRLIPFAIDAADLPITSAFIDALSEHITGKDQRLLSDYESTGSCDCSYVVEGVARFRVNIYRENNHRAIVMRKLQAQVPTLAELELPPVFPEIVKEKNGIVLVTGATGSGKTTTLAALINELNQTQPIHIVTLEDPIEFLHPHVQAAISHRELGRDFYNFAQGLRAALRQAPKAILVGEIRDRETLEIAMTAAETGHVVFSTLHTINAGQTINRILGMFSREEEQQVRQRLAATLRYVVSQRLVSKIGGGRLLVTEIMGSSLRTRETIVYGESENKSFHEIIEAGSSLGWQTFDQSIVEACKSGIITEETALVSCTNKGKMRRELDQLQKQRGVSKEQAPSGLKLHVPEPIRIIEQPPPVPAKHSD